MRFTIGCLTCALLLPAWPFAAIVLMICVFVTLRRVPLKIYFRAAIGPTLFIGIGCATVAWTNPAASFETLCRSLAATSATLHFGLLTPASKWLAQLRRLRVPVVVTDLLLITYRFIYLLADTSAKIRRAQSCRLGNASWRARWRSVSLLAAGLFRMSMDRARRLELGLSARNDHGELRVLTQ